MKGKDIFLGLQYVDAALIEEAEFGAFPAKAETETLKRRKAFRRPFLLAAIIALCLLLVGCGVVYVLKMQDLKVGDREIQDLIWDDELHMPVDATVQQQILTLSGIEGTPHYMAAKEWYEFKQEYDPDHKIQMSLSGAEKNFPKEYDFYSPYTQVMVDKIDEIIQKYDLELIHTWVKGQTSQNVLDYFGLDGVLLPDAPAQAISFSCRATESGYFSSDFNIDLEDGEGVWPYHSMVSYVYTPKNLFNPAILEMNDFGDWQEQNYTTASGYDLLILRSPSDWRSWVFCDRGDATIYLRVETIWQVGTDVNGYQEVIETPMTDEQLKQVLDCFDFSIKPQPGDPALLEGQPISTNLSQTCSGYTVEVKKTFTDGYVTFITLGITAPEDVDLEQYVKEKDLGFGSCKVMSLEDSTYVGVSRYPEADGDGKANTVNFMIHAYKGSDDGPTFKKGAAWNLFLKDLMVETWNEELPQFETSWKQEGIWNFEFTIEDGNWTELEFISQPITTSVCTGWDVNGNDVFHDMTITSLILRPFSSDYTAPDAMGSLDFANYRKEQFPHVVLKDGTRIRLDGTLHIYDDTQTPSLPLEEIDYLELMDGTKLYPTEVDPNRVRDYQLEVKSAVTDGRTAQVVLKLTVPYGTEMCRENCQYSVSFGNFGDYNILMSRDRDLLSKEELLAHYSLGETLEAREDGDGREDTLEIVYTMYADPGEDAAEYFAPGSQWLFHVETMSAERMHYPEGTLTEIEPLWTANGVRNVEFTLEAADYVER